MKWLIEREEQGIFWNYFAEILAEGIECGMHHLEYLMACGKYCDGCGEWRITHRVDCNEEAPTDRGSEFRLIAYDLCDTCDPSDKPFCQ